jgi:hypothetical protein
MAHRAPGFGDIPRPDHHRVEVEPDKGADDVNDHEHAEHDAGDPVGVEPGELPAEDRQKGRAEQRQPEAAKSQW